MHPEFDNWWHRNTGRFRPGELYVKYQSDRQCREYQQSELAELHGRYDRAIHAKRAEPGRHDDRYDADILLGRGKRRFGDMDV